MHQVMLDINFPPGSTAYVLNFPECLTKDQVAEIKKNIEHAVNELIHETAKQTRANIRHQIGQALGL